MYRGHQPISSLSFVICLRKIEKCDIRIQVSIVSVSSDGAVKLWEVVKNELESKNILVLFDKSLEKEAEEQSAPPKACGTCLEFHPLNSYLFLVGTEEGKIYKCSTSYSSQVI